MADGLTAYYGEVQDAAAAGLDASIRNQAAYKAAAKDMLNLLGGLAALDAQLHDVAGQARASVPPPETP